MGGPKTPFSLYISLSISSVFWSAMDSKVLFSATLFLSWTLVAFSQFDGAGLETSLFCMEKLFPCQPFLGSPSPPSPTCCAPLQKLLEEKEECLCKYFDNAVMLNTLGISQEEALQLPKACSLHVDLSICKKTIPSVAGLAGSLSGLLNPKSTAASPTGSPKTDVASILNSFGSLQGLSPTRDVGANVPPSIAIPPTGGSMSFPDNADEAKKSFAYRICPYGFGLVGHLSVVCMPLFIFAV